MPSLSYLVKINASTLTRVRGGTNVSASTRSFPKNGNERLSDLYFWDLKARLAMRDVKTEKEVWRRIFVFYSPSGH
ncbi:uncharacterized protein MEPE_03907 [Melanopsichium pennsylvanicum]|uniref:Uncharacterized protein n=1 Tax=Melanopsichium pennsylvanicum TaxID=63383 RepID=A0AAJ5C641_9BASI|nr:uncharacterized protein MEPE_03907 [Melanopsichium pennsylvanicum]